MKESILRELTNNINSASYIRKCSCCHKEATTIEDLEDFVFDKNSRLDRRNYCKDCKNIDNKVYRPEPKNAQIKKVEEGIRKTYIKNINDNLKLEDSMVLRYYILNEEQIKKQGK
jgi:hypothetical protein